MCFLHLVVNFISLYNGILLQRTKTFSLFVVANFIYAWKKFSSQYKFVMYISKLFMHKKFFDTMHVNIFVLFPVSVDVIATFALIRFLARYEILACCDFLDSVRSCFNTCNFIFCYPHHEIFIFFHFVLLSFFCILFSKSAWDVPLLYLKTIWPKVFVEEKLQFHGR